MFLLCANMRTYTFMDPLTTTTKQPHMLRRLCKLFKNQQCVYSSFVLFKLWWNFKAYIPLFYIGDMQIVHYYTTDHVSNLYRYYMGTWITFLYILNRIHFEALKFLCKIYIIKMIPAWIKINTTFYTIYVFIKLKEPFTNLVYSGESCRNQSQGWSKELAKPLLYILPKFTFCPICKEMSVMVNWIYIQVKKIVNLQKTLNLNSNN